MKALSFEYQTYQNQTKKIHTAYTTAESTNRMTEIKEAFQEIEKFNGEENEDARKWLQKVNGICACFDNMTDQDKLRRIPTKLGPKVFEWFTEKKDSIRDWHMFQEKLLEKYPVLIARIHPLVHVDNFNKRYKQDEETITKYYKDKMELADKVDPQMGQVLRIAALIDGLPTTFRNQLAYKRTEMTTPEKFLAIAQAIKQEIELANRDNLEEHLTRLFLQEPYPTEDLNTRHMVTSIRRHEEGNPSNKQWQQIYAISQANNKP